MNIDVREYLRINPISSYDITVSNSWDDCFLFFKSDENDGGYVVATQRQLFNELYDSIFQHLVTIEDDTVRLAYTTVQPIDWSDAIFLEDNQFSDYVRRSDFNKFKEYFENKIDELNNDVDNQLNSLKNNAVLNYDGAVELMSREMSLYSEFKYAVGQIWCYNQGSNDITSCDRCELDSPLNHTHRETSAETTTSSFVSVKGGSDLVGDFSTGTKQIVSSISNDIEDMQFGTLQETLTGNAITYPLYGQNVIDWRNPVTTHNNVPPSYNIYVRYKEKQSEKGIEPKSTRDSSDDNYQYNEAQYQSYMVSQTDDYSVKDLSEHDYLLRLNLTDDDDVEFKKQNIQSFIDIFAEKAYRELSVKTDSGDFTTMSQILKVILDKCLVTSNSFMNWYYGVIDVLDSIKDNIEEINVLISSIKPTSYVGRIIISQTDDTEKKVIENYGGKKWKRLTNFLRGVPQGDEQLGTRFGEKYVCLRESNIPLHTHDEKCSVLENQNEYMVADRGGHNAKMINTTVYDEQLMCGSEDDAFVVCGDVTGSLICERNDASDQVIYYNAQSTDYIVCEQDSCQIICGNSEIGVVQDSKSIYTTSIEYQISPLEYNKRTAITVPHDNMPPYVEMYMWECVEGDDYTIVSYPIEYVLSNHGKLSSDGAYLYFYSKYSILPYYPPKPVPNEGYSFNKWYPQSIETGSTGKKTFTAQWNTIEYKISYDMNGHGTVPDGVKYSYNVKSPAYVPPEPEQIYGYEFDGWTPTYIPHGMTGDQIFKANWSEKDQIICDPSSEQIICDQSESDDKVICSPDDAN